MWGQLPTEDFYQLPVTAENCFLWGFNLSLCTCWFHVYLIHLHESNILLAERDRCHLSQKSANQVLFNSVRQLGQGKLIVSVKKLMTQWRLPLTTQIVEIIWQWWEENGLKILQPNWQPQQRLPGHYREENSWLYFNMGWGEHIPAQILGWS